MVASRSSSIVPAPSPPSKSFPLFPCFPSFPIEIRSKIWEYALPGPRIIEIDWQQPIGRWVCRPESQAMPSGLLRACKESRGVFERIYWRFLEVTAKDVDRGQREEESEGDLEHDDESKEGGEQQQDDQDGKENRKEHVEDEDENGNENETDVADEDQDSNNKAETPDLEGDPTQSDEEEAAAAEAEYWAENPGFDPETGEPYLPAPLPGSVTYINPLIDTLYICANRQSEITIRPQSIHALASMNCLATLKRLAVAESEVSYSVIEGETTDGLMTSFLPGLTSVVVVMGDICWNEIEHGLDERNNGEIEFTETGVEAIREADQERDMDRVDRAWKLFVHVDRQDEVISSMRRALRGGVLMEYLD